MKNIVNQADPIVITDWEHYSKVTKRKGLPYGQVSYIEPYRMGSGAAKFFTNATYGADMNKNAGFTGTPVPVHNGTDNTYWTATNISGTNFVFDSTAQAYTGTHSIDATATTDGNTMQLANGSPYSTGSYIAITGAIYLTGWATEDDNIRVRLRLDGVNVGNTVLLSTYISQQELNSWQLFSIPISSITTSTVNFNQITIETVNTTGASPNYYLDILQLENTGGTIIYTVAPTPGTIYRIQGFGFGLTDNIAVATGIDPAKMLGVNELPVGIVSLTSVNNELTFTGILKNHMDFATYPNVKINTGGTAFSTWITYSVDFNIWGGTPLVLDSRTNDYAAFIINDDLSGLSYFRILTNGIEEDIVSGENDF